jgi:OOP family OmpA-OmpF porin
MNFLLRVFCMALCAIAGAQAQQRPAPSAGEIVSKLAPPEVPVARGFSARGISVEAQQEERKSASIDLAVNFEYASARLTSDARITLDNLAQALVDPLLRDSRFRIAGHTDARGGDAYNLTLSRQRAQAVADYLDRQHGIKPTRLQVEGYGRAQLADPANPESVVNRRVQVVNLGAAN